MNFSHSATIMLIFWTISRYLPPSIPLPIIYAPQAASLAILEILFTFTTGAYLSNLLRSEFSIKSKVLQKE